MRFGELSLQDEIRWKQRSRVQWLKEGDANTRFFHRNACLRKSRNTITQLSDGSLIFSGHLSLANHLHSFFCPLLGTASVGRDGLNLLYLCPDAPPSLLCLYDPFGLEEVRRAIFACGPDKAPGPDGFPLVFFQRFWSAITPDIMEVFARFHIGSISLDAINKSWICLIPKKNVVETARDLRPLCLENSVIKVISKVLATRLQPFFEEMINPFQNAVVKGRSIRDNFFTAHILSHYLSSTKQRAALLKIDFERAFDHINWAFLLELLEARGFGDRWINWVTNLLRSSSGRCC